MLEKDLKAVKKLLKQFKRTRQFDDKFASMICSEGYRNPNRLPNIEKDFEEKFPNIMIEKQIILYTGQNNFTMNSSMSIASQGGGHPQQNQLSKEYKRIERKKLLVNDQPIQDSNEQIQIIVQALQSLTSGCEHKIFDRIFDEYKLLGGSRTFEELKDKIESDVIFLMKKKMKKERRVEDINFDICEKIK